MSNLVLELKPGEMMLINGASVRFRSKTRLELTSRARFLFGKQIMSEHDAVTPARRLYYALQVVYIGSHEERAAALSGLRLALPDIIEALPDAGARALVRAAMARVDEDDCYAALKLARVLVRMEAVALPDADACEPRVRACGREDGLEGRGAPLPVVTMLASGQRVAQRSATAAAGRIMPSERTALDDEPAIAASPARAIALPRPTGTGGAHANAPRTRLVT